MRKTRPELPSDRVFYCLNQCAPGGIRTPNLLIRSQMLYPLSYGRASTRSQPDDYIRAEAGVRTGLERTASGPGCPPGSRTRCVGKRSARAGRLGVGVVDGVGIDDRGGVASRACRSAAPEVPAPSPPVTPSPSVPPPPESEPVDAAPPRSGPTPGSLVSLTPCSFSFMSTSFCPERAPRRGRRHRD